MSAPENGDAAPRDVAFAWLAASAAAAAARTLLVAYQDGYAQAGFEELALSSAARHFTSGFAMFLAAALPARIAWATTRGLVRVLVVVATVVLGWAFVACRVPPLAYHMPGFTGAPALAAHAASVVAALVAAWLLFGTRPGVLPRVVGVAGLVLALSSPILRVAWSAPDRANAPNVILISLDTLRTDHLSCYGYERDTTPNIDRFAAEGLRFERASAPHPWTLTSHMTMLTGLLPSEHGVNQERRLASDVPTLAELFADAGYDTLALVDPVVWLDERYGFARGFASYRRVHGTADEKIGQLRNVLDDLRGRPFFLFLHFFDAHSDTDALPYDSEARDRSELGGWYTGDFDGCLEGGPCASELLTALNRGEVSVPPEIERYIRDLYDAGVRTLDRDLARLFSLLRARGLLDTSIVVLTADHGEEFREHGQFLHGTHFQECVSVPLVLRGPGIAPGTTRALVGHVDLAATLLELCGLDAALVGGRSYAEVVRGGAEPDPASAVLFDAGDGQLGVRLGDWKLIRHRGALRLFDLANDPGEQRDVAGEEPERLATLEAVLDAEALRLKSRAAESGGREVELSDREREALGNIGYAGDE